MNQKRSAKNHCPPSKFCSILIYLSPSDHHRYYHYNQTELSKIQQKKNSKNMHLHVTFEGLKYVNKRQQVWHSCSSILLFCERTFCFINSSCKEDAHVSIAFIQIWVLLIIFHYPSTTSVTLLLVRKTCLDILLTVCPYSMINAHVSKLVLLIRVDVSHYLLIPYYNIQLISETGKQTASSLTMTVEQLTRHS